MTSSEFITQHVMFDFKKQQEILQQLIKEVNFATLTSVSGNCGCFGGPQLSDTGGQHHTTPSLMFAIHLYLAFILQLLKLFFIQFISTNSHQFFFFTFTDLHWLEKFVFFCHLGWESNWATGRLSGYGIPVEIGGRYFQGISTSLTHKQDQPK